MPKALKEFQKYSSVIKLGIKFQDCISYMHHSIYFEILLIKYTFQYLLPVLLDKISFAVYFLEKEH